MTSSGSDTGERLYTLVEAAGRLRCSRSTVIRRIDAGLLDVVQEGRRKKRYVTEAAITAYVAAHQRNGQDTPSAAGR